MEIFITTCFLCIYSFYFDGDYRFYNSAPNAQEQIQLRLFKETKYDKSFKSNALLQQRLSFRKYKFRDTKGEF